MTSREDGLKPLQVSNLSTNGAMHCNHTCHSHDCRGDDTLLTQESLLPVINACPDLRTCLQQDVLMHAHIEQLKHCVLAEAPMPVMYPLKGNFPCEGL